MTVEFRLLGTVEVDIAGRQLDLGSARQQCVLVGLLVDLNHVVPVDQLVTRVWGDSPPHSARGTLASYLSRLRRALADFDGVAIKRQSGGYVMTGEPTWVDLHRCRQLLDRARATTDSDRAAALYEQALRLWRGDAFATLDTPWLNQLRSALTAELRAAELAHNDLQLRHGRHHDLLTGLSTRAAEHPLDERLAGQLMLALYRAGRQADALRVFHDTRAALVDALGLEPGPELRRLHQRVLAADPELTIAAPADSMASARVPRQLPADITHFSGREAELTNLLATWPTETATTVVITAIDGMAGVGKTALAIHAAHRLAPHFPDGQLFLDLHGYTEQVAPVEPADALDRLLRALGVPGEQIPAHLDDRAAYLRTTLAGRRVLLVLDNGADAAQVRPLLPGVPGCLVLITSRRRLTNLDDAHVMSVDVLPPPDATALFTRTVGPDRLATTAPDLITEIVELCGRLPLAIRIATARLRAHPTWTASHLAERLRDHRNRLEELESGRRSITAALNLSYQHLGTQQQRAYRLLGLHPGLDVDTYAATALTGTSMTRSGQLLDDLLDAHLLNEPTPGRYVLHDLTRAHAARSCMEYEPEANRRAALTRLFDHYTDTASRAMRIAYPQEAGLQSYLTLPDIPPETPTPTLADPGQATAWLDTTTANLVAAATHAAEHGWPIAAIQLAATVHHHLRTRAQFTQAHTLHTNALRAAVQTGHTLGHIHALNGLGDIQRLQCQYEDATESHRQALTLARLAGDRTGELIALRGFGHINRIRGRLKPAIDCLTEALSIARAFDHRTGEMLSLYGLAAVHRLLNKNETAIKYNQQALAIARETGDRTGELQNMYALGEVHRVLGEYEPARQWLEQALAVARDIGNRGGELYALHGLGHIHLSQGRHDSANHCFTHSKTIADEILDPNGQFESLNGLGHTHHATGDLDQALVCHQQALDLADTLGQHPDQARAHHGLALVHRALGNHAKARAHWHQGLAILTDFELVSTDDVTVDEIRAHLTELDQSVSP